MSRVVHFEFPADDPDRAATFYGEVFGWKFQKWEGPQEYWLIATGTEEPGINGGMLRRNGPEHGTVNTVQVDSLDDTVQRVHQLGGSTVVPRMPIPGVGYLAYCKDTEGNMFGVMQPDPAAA